MDRTLTMTTPNNNNNLSGNGMTNDADETQQYINHILNGNIHEYIRISVIFLIIL